ncbi:MAG: hypothetical protein OEW05_07410 [Candidatus Aminicenantes bacterium]|nr:hypothetical protein [Candidatus Aminicenantes bacterium]
MRKTWLVLAVGLLFLPPAPASGQDGYYAASYARLSYVRGDVFVQRGADLGYEKGEVNLALIEGDRLGTRDGLAEVQFSLRNYLRIDRDTQVEFATLPREGDDRIQIRLLEGSLYLRVRAQAEEKGIEVHTPDASYYVLAEGLYRFDVRGGATEVFVEEGELEAAGEEGSLLVRENERLRAADGRFEGDAAYARPAYDEFDRWNSSRDDQLAVRRSSTRYLPTALDAYEDELYENGRWVYEQPYGYVWTPTISYSDWRPYYYGRWVWYPIIGWTWVSSEPWGWCTYHYGRWHWRHGLGWHWIPTSYWGPAWVHWYWDHSYIGWCPLSWYNRPGVIVNNSFYDRYDGYRFPYNNRAMTVVHRNQLQSRDIGRHGLRAHQLRGLGQVNLRAEQPAIRPVVDRSSLDASAAKQVFGRATRPITSSGLRSGAVRAPLRSGTSSGSGAGEKVISPSTLRRNPAGSGNSGATVTKRPLTSGLTPRTMDSSVSPATRTDRSASGSRIYPSRTTGATTRNDRFGSSGEVRRTSSRTSSGTEVRKSPDPPYDRRINPLSSGQSQSSTTARGVREPKVYAPRLRTNDSSNRPATVDRSRVSSPSSVSRSRTTIDRSRTASSSPVYRSQESNTVRSQAPTYRQRYESSPSVSPRTSSAPRLSRPSYSSGSSSRSSMSRFSAPRSSSPRVASPTISRAPRSSSGTFSSAPRSQNSGSAPRSSSRSVSSPSRSQSSASAPRSSSSSSTSSGRIRRKG